MTIKMIVIAMLIVVFVLGAIVSYAGCRAASMAENLEFEAEIQSRAVSSEKNAKRVLP